MADNLGLDRARLRKLEQALQAAYEARHRIVIKDLSFVDEPPPATIAPLEVATDHRTLALERRIRFLEQRIVDLERELEDARAHVSRRGRPLRRRCAEGFGARRRSRGARAPRSPRSARRRLAPRALPSLQEGGRRRPAVVRRAGALVPRRRERGREGVLGNAPRGGAHPAERLGHAGGMEAPALPPGRGAASSARSSPSSCRRCCIGRLSAMRRDKQLIKLDAAQKQDPATTTVQAVRCFHWASAILGMHSPALFADPGLRGVRRDGAGRASGVAHRRAGALGPLRRGARVHRGPPPRQLPRGALREDARPVGARPRGHLPRGALHRKPGPPAERAGEAARRPDRECDRADPRAGCGRPPPRSLPPLRRGGRAHEPRSAGPSRSIARWRARASCSRTISAPRTTSCRSRRRPPRPRRPMPRRSTPGS